MRPLAVHHVSINVTDVAAATAFYTRVLGFTERDDRPGLGVDGAWLDAGGQQLHLIQGAAPPAVGQHFAVLVTDLDDVVAELRGQGLKVSTPSQIGSGRQSFLSDPDGNQIELHEKDGGSGRSVEEE